MLSEIQRLRHFSKRSRIGTGNRPVVIEESQFSRPGFEMRTSTQNISLATDWKICEPRHVFIVHLGGRMDTLETELDGKGGSSGPATPGEVWSVPANLQYASHATGGVIRFAVLSISPENKSEEARDNDRPEMLSSVSGWRDEALTTAVEQLAVVSAETDDVSQMHADSLAVLITHHVFQTYGTMSCHRTGGNGGDPLLTPHETRLLREFIFDNLGNQVSLNILAMLVGMTAHQLLAAFRASFGTTPAQYIITQRLRCAQWHLLHSRLDLTSIALKAGFSSHSHLTSAFTKRFGYPPHQFRQKYAANDG